ncbi:PucR family transcriptional regulator [Peribacillus simplex]|uniref:PucR family transcriptional regulator n=1 Tax=Peribacillus simplex TaxID=1478 RepID=A0A9X8ZI97_9BACI|nr:PucR family transcriptional regulator [Peribacillus simplex]TKH03596.1 PucR family transcriptional regulator [Peribacillus simplex]TKH12929.1 PucR family transcriptional regulator [Peribacillus simplex]
MKVAELLTLPALTGMHLIAGGTGIEREVRTVNMMDAPDIINFLKPNEFLVTTAYHIKDKPHLLSSLVEAMANQGCAALGIKTRRYLKEIPEEALVLANDLSFPIIELPAELSLGEIINHTLRGILDQRAAELTFAMETHKQFTNLIMRGKGIQKLLDHLSDMIGYPILLVDQYLKPIFQPISTAGIIPIIKKMSEEGFRFHKTKTSFFSFSSLSNKQPYTVFPIYMNEEKFGYLTISGEIKTSDNLITLTIEQATNVISFALMKEHALKQHDRNIRNDFFLHFLDGSFSSQEEIINRAKEFSLQNEQTYICAVGKIDESDSDISYTQLQRRADSIYEFLEDELCLSPNPIHLFTKGKKCILLYEVNEVSADVLQTVETSLKSLQRITASQFGCTISFGVSHLSQSFLQTKNSYKEANDSLLEGGLSKRTEYIQMFRTKDIMELLRIIPEEDLMNFYHYALQGFSKVFTEEEQSLLQTLSVYLETHCQISETAKRLFVHRNTVVYRLEKCEELLGKSLKDSETTLQIRLALRIKSLLKI